MTSRVAPALAIVAIGACPGSAAAAGRPLRFAAVMPRAYREGPASPQETPRGDAVPLPAAAERNRFAQHLFTPLPARYDRLAELLSMGQNGRWRRAMIDHIVPAAGQTVLDVASGTAGVALQIAARTTARVVGVDLTEQMLRQGQRNVAGSDRASRIALTVGRA